MDHADGYLSHSWPGALQQKMRVSPAKSAYEDNFDFSVGRLQVLAIVISLLPFSFRVRSVLRGYRLAVAAGRPVAGIKNGSGKRHDLVPHWSSDLIARECSPLAYEPSSSCFMRRSPDPRLPVQLE